MKYDHWARALSEKAGIYAKLPAYKWKEDGQWRSSGWQSLVEDVDKIAAQLLSWGVQPGDNVAIWAENMPEWLVADMAIFAIRAVTVPLYANSPEMQAHYILKETSAKVVFVGEQEQFDKINSIREKLPSLKEVVVFKEPSKPEAPDVAFSGLLNQAYNDDIATALNIRREEAQIDDLATIIYTSGTTGVPKGVMLTHANLIETLRTHDIILRMQTGESSIAFLPMSHIFERAWIYMCLHKGIVVYFNHDPREIQQTLTEVRPNYMCTVPRFWEKVYSVVNDNINKGPAFKKKLFNWTQKVGDEYYLKRLRYGKSVPTMLKVKHTLANAIVYKKVKKTAGLENGSIFPCAGAAIAPEIATFFHRMGIHLMIGYGLTETTASVTVNEYENYDLASIGVAMPDLQVKIGDNNEIMVKGKTVMKGYYKKPIETAEVFDGEWFKTGDAGYFNEAGKLVMTERIKELYKTATGKYVAPNYIESKLGMDTYIEQIVVFGDRKKYITALIAPSVQGLKDYAQKASIAYNSFEDLLSNNKVIKFFEERLAVLQTEFARYEQIKKFKLLKYPFTVESGELTSTLKLRRKIILENYKDLVESMYEE